MIAFLSAFFICSKIRVDKLLVGHPAKEREPINCGSRSGWSFLKFMHFSAVPVKSTQFSISETNLKWETETFTWEFIVVLPSEILSIPNKRLGPLWCSPDAMSVEWKSSTRPWIFYLPRSNSIGMHRTSKVRCWYSLAFRSKPEEKFQATCKSNRPRRIRISWRPMGSPCEFWGAKKSWTDREWTICYTYWRQLICASA